MLELVNEARVAVPGFGFLPPEVASGSDKLFQEYVTQKGVDVSNFTNASLDQMKCLSVMTARWRSLFPSLSSLPRGSVCPPVWDGASCLPPTPAGHTAVLPCMTEYDNSFYSPLYNSSKECLPEGVWGGPTDYSDCMCKGSDQHMDSSTCTNSTTDELTSNPPSLPIMISLVGYTLSLLALVCALAIFFSFREMRCLRHKIHMGLFCAFGLSALNWILTLSWGDLVPRHYATPLLCATFTLTYFFHLTSFYWMFSEGFYLFLQVQYPLSFVSIEYKHFLVFGWGGPMLNTLVWFILRIQDYRSTDLPLWDGEGEGQDGEQEDQGMGIQCLVMEKKPLDRWVMEFPMIIILFFNTFFLIWIMWIVIMKLKQRTAMDHDKRHWKAAKALIFVMPLLGFGHILTLVVQPAVASIGVPLVQQISDCVEAVIASTQGLVISLPYCFLNSEVQGVLANHWKRWRLVRTVGRSSAHLATQTSINTSCTYVINQKLGNQV